jgi:hypothetical protein
MNQHDMPRYNTATKQGAYNAKQNLTYHTSKGHVLDQKHIKKTRTNLVNRALHLYFTNAAYALLEVGHNFIYTDSMTGEMMEIPYTSDLFKTWIWKPLQETMFKIESTTKLETHMINDILTVLTPWLSKKNKLVKFPNKFDQMIEQMNKSNNE